MWWWLLPSLPPSRRSRRRSRAEAQRLSTFSPLSLRRAAGRCAPLRPLAALCNLGKCPSPRATKAPSKRSCGRESRGDRKMPVREIACEIDHAQNVCHHVNHHNLLTPTEEADGGAGGGRLTRGGVTHIGPPSRVHTENPRTTALLTPAFDTIRQGGPTRTSADVSAPRLAGFSLIT